MQAEQLHFDAASHTYRLRGRVLPSVTQVLQVLDQYEGVPPHVLEAAREFGVHVHLATELDDRGQLDEAALDPHLAPYLSGWRKFRRESGFTITGIEQRVVHAKLGYAGTLDRSAIDAKGRLAKIDIKSGMVPKSVGPQVAAYDEADRAMGRWSQRAKRYCVQLMPDDYRLHVLDDPADWSVFLSCLNVHMWRTRNATRS